jgi:uncharacterized protein
MSEFIFIGKKNNVKTSNYLLMFILLLLFLINITTFFQRFEVENDDFRFLIQLLPFTICAFLLLLGYKYILNLNYLEAFTSRKRFSLTKFIFAFTIWGLILLLIFIINYIINPSLFVFRFNINQFILLFIISIIFVSLQTLFEELLFRSLLFQAFGTIFKSKVLIVLISSLFFTLLHLNNPEIQVLGKKILIYFFITGVFLGIITVLDNGIELSFGFHAVNNLFGTIFLTNDWQVFKTKALFLDISSPKINWEIWIILVILYPALIFLYLKISKIKIGAIID